jgi:hypothetical protein
MQLSTPASSRRSFLKRSTGAALAAGSVSLINTSTASADVNTPSEEQAFRDMLQHEIGHVAAVRAALGSNARPKPTFRNLEQPTFAAFANLVQTIENTCVGALQGALPIIFSPEIRGASASLALIEGRHAGFINAFVGKRLTADTDGSGVNNAFEDALTQQQVLALASPFIANLNGGPPLAFSTRPSAANDIAILNFALTFEYLGVEYLSINIAKFFG